MRVVLTDHALGDLDEILSAIRLSFPGALAGFEARMGASLRRIGQWPESAERVAGWPGVRVVPLVRYPYKIFYRITTDAVEILHIHQTARRGP